MCKYRLVTATDHEGHDNGVISILEKKLLFDRNYSLSG